MMKKAVTKLFFLLFLLAFTVGCSLLAKKTHTPQPAQPSEIAPTETLPPQPTNPPIPGPTSTYPVSIPCAFPTDTDLLFTLEDATVPYGLCFLYPADFTVTQGQVPNTWYFTGTPYGSGEKVAATVELYLESANGKTLEQYAADTITQAAPGLKVESSMIYLMPDFVPAIKAEGLPELVNSRMLYIVHNNIAFTLTFMPNEPGLGEAWIDMERIYNDVNNTWVFRR